MLRTGADPFSGMVLVFRARRADRIKIVLWDGSGLVLVSKRLEGGAFRWPPVVDGAVRLTPVEFAALFDDGAGERVREAALGQFETLFRAGRGLAGAGISSVLNPFSPVIHL